MGTARTGRHWLFTAVVAPLGPASYWLFSVYSPKVDACRKAHPAAGDTFSGPCGGSGAIAFVAAAAALILTATVAIALFVGLTEGKNRRDFAYGHWICAAVVGLFLPPTLFVYAAGYGIGLVLPATKPPRPSPAAIAHQQGWDAAVSIYRALVAGHPPSPVVVGGFLRSEPVYLEAQLTYSRYYNMSFTYQPGTRFAMGSKSFVAGAMLGGALADLAGHARAASMSGTQWREQSVSRVVVTDSSTWCNVQGRWLAFDHSAVIEYYLDGANCVLTFAGVEPLRLSGPAAACHAVLFAYFRGGEQWRSMPFLQGIAAG